MTSTTIKTVLFASLTMALFVSFSGMEFAHAEKVTDSLSIPNEERDIKLAAGYKLYPGVGWVSPTEIRDAPKPVYIDNPNNPGEQILDLDAMIKNAEEAKIKQTSGNIIQDFLDSFVQLAHAALTSYHISHKDSSSNDFTYQRAYWEVPTSPGTYNGGTNFNFNAVQPNLSSTIIFQPVLQHGYSSICDAGNDWVTYPAIIVGGSAYTGSCIDADEGDLIRGILSEGANNIWTVSIKNYQNSAATDSYSVSYSGQMDAAFTAVETHNIPTNCNELEGDVEYKWMTDTGDVDSWVAASQGSTFCGMSTNIVSDATVQFNNNN